MAQQKKGFIARLLEGKERSEEYARSTLPTNRWQLFFDIFKGNFSKIVIVNLLTMVFFLPLLGIIVFGIIINSSNGVIYPFGANLAVGYPAYDGIRGLSQSLSIWTDLGLYIAVIASSVLAAIGLAGGMYVIRNMVWTEGVFVANDFWRGVKLNYKNALQTAVFFCVVLMFCTTMNNFSALSLATADLSKFEKVWLHISQGASFMFIGLALIMSLWMIALGVNYKMGFFAMFRNAFLMGLGTFPQTVFFGAIALAPLLLFMIGGTMFTVIGILIMLVFGFSYALLVWLDFAQWVFDKYINPKLQGAKVGRGIYNKDGSSSVSGGDSQASLEYQRIILAHGRSRLVARPIKPIDDSLQVYELPQSFTREDLKRLRESKENIAVDTEAYAEEHKNDLRYVEYNKQFDEREKALQEQESKKGKKKKLKPPKMLGE